MKALFYIGFLLLSVCVWAAPAQVLIIRHAEKPKTGKDLSEAGRARAAALVQFFQTDSRMLQYGTPVAIYAMAPATSAGTERPIETVSPLAQALHLNLIEKYARGDESAAAAEIMNDPQFDGKMVLICWEHNSIPPLASALGLANAPSWPGNDVYDRVWELNYAGATVSSHQDLAQHLMPGDSPL